MTKFLIIILSFFLLQCKKKDYVAQEIENTRSRQDSLILKYSTNCAKIYNYRYQMKEWQNCLDEGLKLDSTVAYLWQQKAMPYFKAKKYEIGMAYLDKAVKYDSTNWLSYRAFIKCIFAKTYKEAIKDFEQSIKIDGNTYVQDHTYKFHIALCYLQLNEFKKAESIFNQDIIAQEKKWKEAHFLDLFYYGISKYEQGKWLDAIVQLDKSLKEYPNFSDALYYKAICLLHLNKIKDYNILLKESKKQAKIGNTINEANAVYETYPYQVRWK